MKSKNVFVKVVLLSLSAVLCSFLTSCTTTKYVKSFQYDTEDLRINEKGLISFGKPGDNSEDIYITGYLDNNNYENIASIVMGFDIQKLDFKGNVTIDEIEYKPEIEVIVRHEIKRRISVNSIQKIEIKLNSDTSAVEDFSANADCDLFCKYIKSKDMPYFITSFVSNQRKYKVYATKFLANNKAGKGNMTPFELFTAPNQLFQILDEQNNPVAEFDAASYKIFAPDVDVDEFKLIIASLVISGKTY